MAIPFSTKWEVTSLRSNHGSFVEAAKVRPLAGQQPGDWWVERPVGDLKPAHRERVKRRWWLASQLTSPVWPTVLDAGDDAGDWAVVESPGRRTDGTFPFADPQLAIAAIRGLALGVAEVETTLLKYSTSPHLSVRAATLTRDEGGLLHFHLAALDAQADQGFPATPQTWMWSPEELFGQPQSARTNVFTLAWLASLMLTGRSPWGAPAEGQSESQRREALKPLISGGKFQLSLPEALKGIEVVLKKALSPTPAQRHATSAALAEALAAFAPGTPAVKHLTALELALPTLDPSFETLAGAMESKLLTAPDESPLWNELAVELGRTQSPRARLITGELSNAPGELTPSVAGEQCEFVWRKGYVRQLTVRPGSSSSSAGDARVLELTAFLLHPSMRFLNELTLAGSVAHARTWLDALQRAAPASLRRVTTQAIAATDPVAVDIAFRFPKWTWAWGGKESAPALGFLKKWFGK